MKIVPIILVGVMFGQSAFASGKDNIPLIGEGFKARIAALVEAGYCSDALDFINITDEQQKQKADYGDDSELWKYNKLHNLLMGLQFNVTLECDSRKKAQQQKEADKKAEEYRLKQEEERKEQLALQKMHDDINTCKDTDKYRLYFVQEEIIGDYEWIAAAKEDLKKENMIGRISGYTDKDKRYDDGAIIVEHSNQIKDLWPEYKRLGGKAKTPEKIKHSVKNPCEELENSAEQPDSDYLAVPPPPSR